MVEITLYAGAAAAAGTANTQLEGETLTVGQVENYLLTLPTAAENLGRVLQACSFLVDGKTTQDRQEKIGANAKVDVLPPFAGG